MVNAISIIVSLSLLSIGSIGMNSLCLHFMRVKKLWEKPSTILLANLLITNMVQGLFVQPMHIAKSLGIDNPPVQELIDTGYLFSYLLAFYGVCLGALLVALDRFFATFLAQRYKIYVTLRKTLCVLAGMWIYILILCLIPFLSHTRNDRDSEINNNSSVQPFNPCVMNTSNVAPINLTTIGGTHEMASSENFNQYRPHHDYTPVPFAKIVRHYIPQKRWILFMLFINAVTPFVLMLFLSAYVLWKLRIMGKRTRSDTDSFPTAAPGTSKEDDSKNTTDLTYYVIGIHLTYFALWTPTVIYDTLLCSFHSVFPHGMGELTR